MFHKAFRSLCAGCGRDCNFNKILCPECVALLPRPRIFCGGCGHPLAVPAEYCKHCEDRGTGINRYFSDYLYTGVMRNVIREIKFNWRWRGANQLGELCEASKLKPEDYDKTTPIPFHFIRRFVRYVQPVSVITETFKQRGFICEKTLARTVHTEYQSKLSRSERRLNVKGAFEINKDVNGMRILIIDDVITTGATVTEAARTLKKNGAAWVDVYTLLTGVPR